MVFKWDPKKAATNLKKHGVDFYEALSVLSDVLSTTYPDADHSSPAEPRFLTIGMSNQKRILVVIHAEAEGRHAIRIVSARPATRQERRFYEEG